MIERSMRRSKGQQLNTTYLEWIVSYESCGLVSGKLDTHNRQGIVDQMFRYVRVYLQVIYCCWCLHSRSSSSKRNGVDVPWFWCYRAAHPVFFAVRRTYLVISTWTKMQPVNLAVKHSQDLSKRGWYANNNRYGRDRYRYDFSGFLSRTDHAVKVTEMQ